MLGFVLLVTACQEGPSPDLMSVGPQLEPAIRAAHTTAAARIAYDRLTSPKARLVVGWRCYLAPHAPPGANEARVLVDSGRVDILRKLASAPAPEARVYGAIGLRELGVIDSETFARMLSDIEGPVQTCNGCIFWTANAKEAAAAHDEWFTVIERQRLGELVVHQASRSCCIVTFCTPPSPSGGGMKTRALPRVLVTVLASLCRGRSSCRNVSSAKERPRLVSTEGCR